jgi:hypothetical protein
MGVAACKNTDFTHIFHDMFHYMFSLKNLLIMVVAACKKIASQWLASQASQASPVQSFKVRPPPRKLLLHKSIFHIMLYLKLYPPNPNPKVNLKLCACELSEKPGTSPCLGFFSTLTLVALVVWNVFIPLAIESFGHVHILGGNESSN